MYVLSRCWVRKAGPEAFPGLTMGALENPIGGGGNKTAIEFAVGHWVALGKFVKAARNDCVLVGKVRGNTVGHSGRLFQAVLR